MLGAYREFGKIKPVGRVRVNPAHPLARGLVGFWLFNQPNPTVAHDAAGRYHGAISAGSQRDPYWSGAIHGSTFNFATTHPVGGGTIFADCGSIPLDGQHWTIAIRAKRTSASTAARRVTAWAGSGPTLYLDTPTQRISIVHAGTIDLASTTDGITNNETFSAAITRTGSRARIYKNGRVIASSDSFAVSFTNDTNFFIGKSGSGSFPEPFAGLIDYEGAWSRGLTEPEVKLLHEAPFDLFELPLLDEPFGITAGGGGAAARWYHHRRRRER